MYSAWTPGKDRFPRLGSWRPPERKVASGAARGEDLLWYAQSYFRAGKPAQAMALVKDDPAALLRLYTKLTPDKQRVLARLRPDVEADWLRALSQQPDLEDAAFAWARSLVQSGVAPSRAAGWPKRFGSFRRRGTCSASWSRSSE
jgi:hypothetical protein